MELRKLILNDNGNLFEKGTKINPVLKWLHWENRTMAMFSIIFL